MNLDPDTSGRCGYNHNMASIGAKVEAAKAKRQHVFQSERMQAFSDTVFAIVATFAVPYPI
jgi:hypothetical protein